MYLGAMSRETHDLILAAALLSITLNPFVFALIDRIGGRPQAPVPVSAGEGSRVAAEGPSPP